MKKIININLSGRVIPIEDSAYEKLQNYIDSLRRYFAHEEGKDEIINDIESRIAELMNDKVRKGAAAITDADVEEIAASMGRVEDFRAEEADSSDTGSTSSEGAYTEPRRRGRLYRDSSDKFIGGVCSGIANYLNTDPAIVRILFAIITFGGFGLGFLLYLLLWMVLPTKDLDNYAGKRLFRNPDDRIIGGVAGGLAAYFNSRVSTVRLIFAAPLVLSLFFSLLDGLTWQNDFDFFPNIIFGSLSGTFILAYVILWMVLPEARSPYEKMEMRGEKVDVNSIRQNVKEGMGNMKDRMKDWGEEVKQSAENLGSKAKEFANTSGKRFASEINETARTGGRGIGHAIGVLFKVFFLFVVGSIAFGLFIGLIALIFGGVAWWPINDFLWTSSKQQLFAWGTLLFFFAVPLIAFFTWVIRRIIRVRSRNSYLGWVFGTLWAIGWVAATLFASSLFKDFREKEQSDVPIQLTTSNMNKMIVAVSEPKLTYTGRFEWMNDNEEGWDLSKDTLKMSSVGFIINASPDSLYHVVLRKYAFGRSIDDARSRAAGIQYEIVSRDSVLDLANGYAIAKENKFRGQNVDVLIMVPIGKKIRFDESVSRKLDLTHSKLKKSTISKNGINIEMDEYYFRPRTGVDYTMGIDGNLTDSEGKTIRDSYRYEYPDSVQLKIEIEEKKRELRELEERQNRSTSSMPTEEIEKKSSMLISRGSILSVTGTYF